MSSKLIKQAIQQVSALDEIASSKNDGVKTKQKKKTATHTSVNVERGSLLESSVESILLFDNAFSNRSSSANTSLNQRQKVIGKKKSKKVQEPLGNSRSSSSIYARKAHVPTFNKKRHMSQKKIKDLKELARMLKRDKK
mmetsp:Transcript_11654/g.21794  ORF Transcript_11654/g.21794 Transcript_11654/m.21794 type:complete len:139 (-) Transcript_11654:2634-3050(-)